MRLPATMGVGLAFLLACSFCWVQAQEPQGADLAQRLGCFACHSPEGQKEGRAAPMDGVGARLTARELRIAITLPRQLHPRAQMPSYAYLPPAEQEALVHFLENLK